MALQATPYKVELNLSNLDLNRYANLRFTVARHPSETKDRLAARLIAYAFWYNESLSFGRGLSDVDEPALWEKSLDDRVIHWIEVGQPDADRLIWCSRRAEQVSLLTYGAIRVWQEKTLPPVKTLSNLSVWALDPEALAVISEPLTRTVYWDVMISEGSLFITDEQGQHEVPLTQLLG